MKIRLFKVTDEKKLVTVRLLHFFLVEKFPLKNESIFKWLSLSAKHMLADFTKINRIQF